LSGIESAKEGSSREVQEQAGTLQAIFAGIKSSAVVALQLVDSALVAAAADHVRSARLPV